MIQSSMRKWGIGVIILLALFLRLVHFPAFPVGFNADEASFGYDAYSILLTGKDQWGQTLPLVLKSFGDYKAPLYTYLSLLFVKVFGLTEFAVRLPNILIGILSVFAVYLLVKEVFRRHKLENGNEVALAAALLLAVNPWHVMMSRGAFEANLITFFLPLAIYFFMKGLDNARLLSLSALFFGLSFFTYHSAKLISPLVFFALLVIYHREIIKIKFKSLLVPIIVFLVFFVGMLYTFKIGGGARISERSITNGALEAGAEEKIRLITLGENPTKARLLHNKYQVIASRFVSNYSQYFSARFLLTKGAAESTYGMRQGIGAIYIFEGILLLGLIPLIIKKETRYVVLPFLFWLIIAPLPAALATGIGFAGNRAEGMLPVLQILEAFGAFGLFTLLKKVDKIKLPVLILFSLFVAFQVYSFVRIYFTVPKNDEARQMLVGSLEVGEWLSQNADGKNVIVSRSISEPQIFIAFGGKLDPSEFQESTKTWGFEKSDVIWIDQLPGYSVGKYTFKSIDWKDDSIKSNTFIVARPDDLPKGVKSFYTLYYPDGTPNILVIDTDQSRTLIAKP